jgi:hypothetical protein
MFKDMELSKDIMTAFDQVRNPVTLMLEYDSD